ncbi:hypothetical protein N7478_000182 [Penicillium angulare]|uniref:uncharacterized protein n=1 Tax=Penicillium angulare TaxID=116970 RepID=UPI0025413788|nr:uncharacterized protein N7478_000182 [Penicillium angulare]KAJ5290931.1 hypothetical protein N7478_000182 [Penicillium angulare]
MDVSHASSSSHTNTQWTGMASQDDQRLRDVGVAALAAVSQYPHPVNGESGSFLVSQVVGAVSGNSRPRFEHADPTVFGTEAESSGTDQQRQHLGAFDTESSMISESESSSRSPVHNGDVDMESVVQELIERTVSWHNTATIASAHDYGDQQKDLVMDYEPTFEDYSSSSPSSGPDDDIEDLIKFYPGEEKHLRQYHSSHVAEAPAHDVNLDEFYTPVDYDPFDANAQSEMSTQHSEMMSLPEESLPIEPPVPVEDYPIAQTERFMPDEDYPIAPAEHFVPPLIHTTTFERNYTIDEFIHRWMVQSLLPAGFRPDGRMPRQFRPISQMIGWEPPLHIHRPSKSKRDTYDLQQIPWAETLKVKRADARTLRDAWYTSYHNISNSHISHAGRLPSDEAYFRAKSMHTEHKASIEHFQLRNLMSVPAYNTVHFASRSKIYSWTPAYDDFHPLIDLSQADLDVGIQRPVKISTMKTQHGLTVAGGFCGEYGLHSSNGEGAGARGLLTPDFNDGITNHVDIIRNRTGRSPICVFASNDRHLRILDTETNIFLSDQALSRPINCTATSPDSRLRVVIGDSPDAWIIEADTGRPVHPLRGHRDFGFACAWSPDMRHIATSNQDKTVNIWDARTWRVLATIDSDVAGYRSLRFSPIGGGPRTLLCCEPADRISIIDAQLYKSRQVHDFFGEVGGADYSPDGSVVWVANTDPHFGGFMQYDRRQWGAGYSVAGLPNEWLSEADLEDDDRCALNARERKLRFLRNLSDREHDKFLP